MIFAILGGIFLLFAGMGFLVGAEPWISYLHLGAGLGLGLYGLLTGAAELRELMGRDASKRGARLGGNALLQAAALAALLGGIAFLSVRYPVKWDWTEAGLHSLATATADLLEQIPADRPVEIFGFFTSGSEQPATQLLDRYSYQSDRVSYRIHDPNRRPDLAERFEVRQDGILLVCGGPCASARGTVKVFEATEQELTRAIRSVISEQKKVYFLSGHGEAGLDDESASGLSVIKDAMEAENLIVEGLLLAAQEAVPQDADAVVLAGATHSLFGRELEALDRYLRAGGSLAVLSDPIVVTQLEERVHDWGIELGADIVVDQTIDLFTGPRIGVSPLVSDYDPDHPITKDMSGAVIQLQLARSLQAVEGVETVELARTGEASWAETDLEMFSNQNQVGLDPAEDRGGPVAVAMARSFPSEEEGRREGRLVVVGDGDFTRNRHIAKGYNADFFINITSWLVGEEEFITIDRKVPRASLAAMTRAEFATFQYVSLFILPEGILLAGILNWWRRRRS